MTCGKMSMGEMDSTGSCDSVVSFNSCFSDDSLEFLSAEEKACLMFLEETIQSLDTEDDSGLSNDEPDQIPTRGNVATKAARLSASIGLNKPPGRDVSRHHFEVPLSSSNPEKNEILNYMVPTPFILANCNSQIPNRPGVNVRMASDNAPPSQEAPQNPSEVNVDVTPPPYKIKIKKNTEENLNTKKSSRSPLSYEGLVQLRKTASVQKNKKPEQQHKSLHISNDEGTFIPGMQTFNESINSKPIPPPVAPKPKIKASINQQSATNPKTDSTMPFLTADTLMNPEKVRLEALCKLGLLKVEPSNMRKLSTLSTKGHSESAVHSLTTCEPHHPKPEKLINQPVPSIISTDPPSSQHTSMTSVGRAATLEHAGMGRSKHEPSGSDITQLNTVYSAETKNHPRDVQIDQVSSSRSKSQHVQGFSVSVPSIGKDRREALRKLGLLKN